MAMTGWELQTSSVRSYRSANCLEWKKCTVKGTLGNSYALVASANKDFYGCGVKNLQNKAEILNNNNYKINSKFPKATQCQTVSRSTLMFVNIFGLTGSHKCIFISSFAPLLVQMLKIFLKAVPNLTYLEVQLTEWSLLKLRPNPIKNFSV